MIPDGWLCIFYKRWPLYWIQITLASHFISNTLIIVLLFFKAGDPVMNCRQTLTAAMLPGPKPVLDRDGGFAQ
jgi:hypothetical protein